MYFTLFAWLALSLAAFPVQALEVAFEWSCPETRMDGSPLNEALQYVLYYGTRSGEYTHSLNVGATNKAAVKGLEEGITYFFAVTARDSVGLESPYSDELSWNSHEMPEPASAEVMIGHLEQTFNGDTKRVSINTLPEGLPVHVTYDGIPEEPVDAGSYIVVATIEGLTHTGSATATLTIRKADQQIEFPSISDQLVGNRILLAASSHSGLPISFAASGPAHMEGHTLVCTGAGTAWVTVSQEGDANWNAATSLVEMFSIYEVPEEGGQDGSSGGGSVPVVEVPSLPAARQLWDVRQPVSGRADGRWSFLTAWNLSTQRLEASASWRNGVHIWEHTADQECQWIARFAYDQAGAQTRAVAWYYHQRYVQ